MLADPDSKTIKAYGVSMGKRRACRKGLLALDIFLSIPTA